MRLLQTPNRPFPFQFDVDVEWKLLETLAADDTCESESRLDRLSAKGKHSVMCLRSPILLRNPEASLFEKSKAGSGLLGDALKEIDEA